jgi:hypothetical protein
MQGNRPFEAFNLGQIKSRLHEKHTGGYAGLTASRRMDRPTRAAWWPRKKNRGTSCSHKTRTRPFPGSTHRAHATTLLSMGCRVLKRASKHPKRIVILARSTARGPPASVSMCCADSAVHMQMQWCHTTCVARACAVTRERMTGAENSWEEHGARVYMCHLLISWWGTAGIELLTGVCVKCVCFICFIRMLHLFYLDVAYSLHTQKSCRFNYWDGFHKWSH